VKTTLEMTIRRLTRVSILLAAAGLGCNADSQFASPGDPDPTSAPKPADEDIVTIQSAFIDSGNNPDRTPQEIKALGEFGAKLAGYYSHAKTAVEIAQFLGVALGWMDAAPTQQQLFLNLENKLNAVTRANAYDIRAQANADRWADLKDALVLGQQALNQYNQGLGPKMDRSWSAFDDSMDAVTALEYPATWTRVHDPAFINGSWRSILPSSVQPETSIGSDGNTRTYDWRLVVPLYLDFLAMRLQVIAVVDPDFRTLPETPSSNRTLYWTEFNGRIATLRAHYNKIRAGIKCAYAYNGNPGIRRACVDLASGIQAVYDGSIGGDPGEARLRTEVEKLTPLFQLKQAEYIHTLYRDMNLRELGKTGSDSRALIQKPLDAAGPQRCLYDLNDPANFGLVYADEYCPTGSPSAFDWTYDRQTGTVRNDSSGLCLYAGSVVPYGSPWDVTIQVRSTHCNSAEVAERGLWAYDPVTQQLMNNQHLMHLDWQMIGNSPVPVTAANTYTTWLSPPRVPTAPQQIEAVQNADGRLELSFIGPGGSLLHNSQNEPNGAWNGVSAFPGAANQIAMARNADGRLEIFYVGTNHVLYHNFQTTPNGGWHGELPLGGWNADSYVRQVAVGQNLDGRLEVFYIAYNNTIYHNFQTAPNAGWHGELALDGAAKQIAVGRNLDGRLQIFLIGTNDAIYHNSQVAPNDDWGGVASFGGWAKQIAAAQNQDGRLEVFYIGTDDGIYHSWQSVPNGEFSGHWALGGSAKVLVMGQNQDGRLEAFYIGMDGNLHHNQQAVPNGWWSGHVSFGESASQLAVGRNQDGRQELFFANSEGTVFHRWQVSPNSGTWSSVFAF
jgi:hypothetical protein